MKINNRSTAIETPSILRHQELIAAIPRQSLLALLQKTRDLPDSEVVDVQLPVALLQWLTPALAALLAGDDVALQVLKTLESIDGLEGNGSEWL
jgi:hypothetical protein